MATKIDDLIPCLKSGWVAWDSYNGWIWFKYKPITSKYGWTREDTTPYLIISDIAFDIEPAEDWTKSLRKVD